MKRGPVVNGITLKEKRAAYKRQNREKFRAYGRKNKYGITQSEYKRYMLVQGGACAVCGELNRNGRALAVDHDHAGGGVRGLLCTRCNTGLGMFQDNPALLRVAADYLDRCRFYKKHPEMNV